ncbi:UDP-glucose 4-epimerase [Clostridium tetani]|uniref:UDP-glucuronate decarboxylase n=1 Tax=Clostridium tetani TaxID=1513 RepID=A0ABC8EEF2_CLOTA|nr:GDP-mannose 4,6-dehydratase [Clostridium tetani]BDR67481.1 UDP-glucose 4-epimerase [Clostridium tetani]BDR81414.1 UDP-glucose 4-epimerase [Clostridium tetani]BDR89794.1 UDP-glucose 4-epimerase [Clostridium tetani]
MKTLITGVAGLTGSYLVEKCLAEGEQVIGIDNLFRGTMSNLEGVMNDKNFQFIKGDVLDISKMELKDIDRIYHLAAIVPTKYFYEAPVDTYMINCHGTKVMIDWALKNNVKKFVNASSSEIYGHPQRIPTDELTPTLYDAVEITPRWSYAQGKILTEHIGNYYKDKIDICHLRYANVYGPRDIDDNHVIPYLINRVLRGEKIIINKDADKIKRTFLYMSDCSDATYLAMQNSPSGESYNIGSNQEVTIQQLLDMIFKITGKTIEVEYSLHREGDPQRRLLDTTKAKKMLGMEIKVSLEEGIRKTSEWIKKYYNL